MYKDNLSAVRASTCKLVVRLPCRVVICCRVLSGTGEMATESLPNTCMQFLVVLVRTGWEPEAATLDALRVSRRCHETEPNTSNAGGFAPNGLDCRRLGC